MSKSLTRYEVGQRIFAIMNYTIADGIPDALQVAVLDCINGAIDEMVNEAPSKVFSSPRSSLMLGGSSEVTHSDVEHGKQAITLTVPEDDEMRIAGCAIVIPGDPRINRLIQCDLYTADVDPIKYFCLAYPYLHHGGKAGWLADPPATATVYFDTWQLREEEIEILEPVEIQTADGSKQELVQAFDSIWTERAMVSAIGSGRVVGLPDSFAVEMVQAESSFGTAPGEAGHPGQLRSWIRLNKWSETPYSLQYRAKIKTERWQLDDIMTNDPMHPTGKGHYDTSLPWGWESSVLIPIAEQRLTSMRTFLSESITAIDRYTREGILSEVFRKYEAALKILRNLHPQRQGASYMVASN